MPCNHGLCFVRRLVTGDGQSLYTCVLRTLEDVLFMTLFYLELTEIEIRMFLRKLSEHEKKLNPDKYKKAPVEVE